MRSSPVDSLVIDIARGEVVTDEVVEGVGTPGSGDHHPAPHLPGGGPHKLGGGHGTRAGAGGAGALPACSGQ